MNDNLELEEPLLETPESPKKEAVSRNVILILLCCCIWGLADSIWAGTILVGFLEKLVDTTTPSSSNSTHHPTMHNLTHAIIADDHRIFTLSHTNSYFHHSGFGKKPIPPAPHQQHSDANTKIGIVEAASGVACLVFAIPVGYIADRHGKTWVCFAGGCLFLIAAASTLFAIFTAPLTDDPNNTTKKNTSSSTPSSSPSSWLPTVSADLDYWLLFGSMILWGIGQGIFNGPMQALFADSVRQGQRSYWYALLLGAYLIPSAVGPLICVIFMKVTGNEQWTLRDLKPLFIAGVCCEIPAAFIAMNLSDKYALKEDDDKTAIAADGNKDSQQLQNVVDHPPQDSQQLAKSPSANQSQQEQSVTSYSLLGCVTLTRHHIPYLLFFSDVITAIGSGCTVKFFPLFFKQDIKLLVSDTQIIYTIAPVLISVIGMLTQRASRTTGRVQMMLLTSWTGISLLVLMAVLYEKFGITHWWIIVPIYLIRTGLMNSSYPLKESILMDFVPKGTRARWKSLDSVAMFGWSGSALLGGVIADKQDDYTYTFYTTAALQGVGTLMVLSLLPLIPRKESLAPKTPIVSHKKRKTATTNSTEKV